MSRFCPVSICWHDICAQIKLEIGQLLRLRLLLNGVCRSENKIIISNRSWSLASFKVISMTYSFSLIYYLNLIHWWKCKKYVYIFKKILKSLTYIFSILLQNAETREKSGVRGLKYFYYWIKNVWLSRYNPDSCSRYIFMYISSTLKKILLNLNIFLWIVLSKRLFTINKYLLNKKMIVKLN